MIVFRNLEMSSFCNVTALWGKRVCGILCHTALMVSHDSANGCNADEDEESTFLRELILYNRTVPHMHWVYVVQMYVTHSASIAMQLTLNTLHHVNVQVCVMLCMLCFRWQCTLCIYSLHFAHLHARIRHHRLPSLPSMRQSAEMQHPVQSKSSVLAIVRRRDVDMLRGQIVWMK